MRLVRAGNAVAVGGHRIVAGIDGEYADRHEYNRGNHQYGEKSGMFGGHIRKLFRLGPDEIRQTSRHLRAWQSALLVRLLPGETVSSYTRKKLPATERFQPNHRFSLEKPNWLNAVAKPQRDTST